MGKKKQRKYKKARANEFLSITSMPDKNEDRSEQSQSGKRINDGEGSQSTTAPRSSTVSRETKQSSSLNDSGLDDSRETAESESVTRSGIDTKLTASEPVDLYGNHTVDRDAPAILTEQVMRLDIQHNTDQSFGLNLNADAPVFIPTFNEKSTSDVAVSSCDWVSHPSMDLKPTLSEQSDYASCQSTNFSNANRHSNKAGPVDSSSQDSRKPGVRCKSHEVSKDSDLSDDCTTAVDEEKCRSKSTEKTRKDRSKSRDRKSEKKHRSKSRSKEQTNADDCRESKDMNYGSHSDRIDLPSESKKRNRGKNSSFRSQHHDQEKDTRSDNTSADNWRSKDHRQSCDSFNRDKTGPPQGRSLGDGRQTKKLRDPRMERGGKSANWRDDSQNEDSEYKEFEATERSNKEMKYVRVEEKTTDLFEMPKEYSLGHCVAEDLSMGSGIAVHFKREFKGLGELYDQRQKQGGLAVLEQQNGESKRYIYYLVTKRESSGKPTYHTFWSSLKKMRDHVRDNEVKKLAIPRIGCGLDRLEWSRVKPMIEFLFRDVDVEVVVCNFQQEVEMPIREARGVYCKVVRETYHIAKLENGSIIIYFSTEDGFIPDEMLALQSKCNFLSKFKQATKAMGEVVRFDDWPNNNIVYGCIVRRNTKQPFHFSSFVKCLAEINKQNRRDDFNYVGIPAIRDENDHLLESKVLNIAKTYLRNVDIYYCAGTGMDDSSQDKKEE